MYKILVVDFDATFQPEDGSDVDCAPAVYLIAHDECEKAKELVNLAKSDWEGSDGDKTLQEYIEDLWQSRCVAFKYVGVLDITYEERQTEYLCGVEEVCI